MKHCFFIILILISVSLKAQKYFDEGKIVLLHPSVGLTITENEKIKYSLFPEYQDSVFESAYLVKYNDSTFTFLFKTKYNGRFERVANIAEIDMIYNKIEVLSPASNTTITYFNPQNPKEYKYSPIEDMENEKLLSEKYERIKNKVPSERSKKLDTIIDVSLDVAEVAGRILIGLIEICSHSHSCRT